MARAVASADPVRTVRSPLAKAIPKMQLRCTSHRARHCISPGLLASKTEMDPDVSPTSTSRPPSAWREHATFVGIAAPAWSGDPSWYVSAAAAAKPFSCRPSRVLRILDAREELLTTPRPAARSGWEQSQDRAGGAQTKAVTRFVGAAPRAHAPSARDALGPGAQHFQSKSQLFAARCKARQGCHRMQLPHPHLAAHIAPVGACPFPQCPASRAGSTPGRPGGR